MKRKKDRIHKEPNSVVAQGIQCPNCMDIVVSLHRHDFRSCGCGKTFIDGGFDYTRCGAEKLDRVKEFRIRLTGGSRVPTADELTKIRIDD